MVLTVKQVQRRIGNIETQMLLKGVTRSEFLADAQVGKTLWSLAKNGHVIPGPGKWADILEAEKRLKER